MSIFPAENNSKEILHIFIQKTNHKKCLVWK